MLTVPCEILQYVEEWNGSTWTEVTDLNTAESFMSNSSGTAGSTTDALVFGGYISLVHQQSANTESMEWYKLD